MTRRANREGIAFVVPRYGEMVVGGAETLCRVLAENLTAHGTRVDVLTTCATDHFTWRNDLDPGETIEGGVHHARRLLLVRPVAEGHRPEAKLGDLEPAAPEAAILHAHRPSMALASTLRWTSDDPP